MDPCPFARLIVESLALKLPTTARSPASNSGVHPSTTPCYCKITLKSFPSQTALLPLITSSVDPPSPDSTTSAEGFHLEAEALRRLTLSLPSPAVLRVSVYSGRAAGGCGGGGRKLVGRVEVAVDMRGAEARAIVYQSGWMRLGKGKEEDKARIHVVVRSEPEPRFVFQFGGEPECSPVVFQVQGNSAGVRQPVFSCKFSADRNTRSRSLPSNFGVKRRGWLQRTLSGDLESRPRERKGWMVMIYDLSGSAVAAASIITPFVPSPGTDRVSRSNPGAWLILRPSHHPSAPVDSWNPWGRLEAWRERGGPTDGLGYRFELATEAASCSPVIRGVSIAEGTVDAKDGGEFRIDGRAVRGFVMGSSVEGEGKESRPVVAVGAQHVTCMGDAALFLALAAAVDLSMDACRLFSRRLRKELCSDKAHLD